MPPMALTISACDSSTARLRTRPVGWLADELEAPRAAEPVEKPESAVTLETPGPTEETPGPTEETPGLETPGLETPGPTEETPGPTEETPVPTEQSVPSPCLSIQK